MEVTLDPLWTAGGIGLSVVADRAWAAVGFPNNQVVSGIPFEHAHVGLASFIVALRAKEKERKLRGAAVGFGTGLIIEDAIPGPELGNYFGLYNPAVPTAPVFVLGIYAIEFGVIAALASRG